MLWEGKSNLRKGTHMGPRLSPDLANEKAPLFDTQWVPCKLSPREEGSSAWQQARAWLGNVSPWSKVL